LPGKDRKKNQNTIKMKENEIAKKVVHAAYQVHQELGPGLLESVYVRCLQQELKDLGLQVHHEKTLPVIYKSVKVKSGFRLDLWGEEKVIVEVKAVKELDDIHLAQILTYLKLTDNRLGFLINFNV
jgi:GxxExxY protein